MLIKKRIQQKINPMHTEHTNSGIDTRELATLIGDRVAICSKEVLTAEEAALYMGISKARLYKYTCEMQIPHYRPGGKRVYFNRLELEAWLQQNPCATTEEINDRANRYMLKGGVR